MSFLRVSVALFVAAGATLVAPTSAFAQTNVNWIGDVGDFNDGSNWDVNFPPLGIVGDIGHINNGGTAVVSDMPDPVGGIVLGADSGDSGTLEIQSGGSLEAMEDQGVSSPGSVIVGQSGTGHLIVERGGSITAQTLSSGGNSASSIVLGEGGTGTASVTVHGAANLNRNLRVVGPAVDFSAGSLSLGGTFTSVITGASHSTLSVSGAANLGGTLQVDFDGHTPSVGDSWDFIDASSINGNFAVITSAFQPAPGQRFATTTVAGGANGSLLRVEVQQILAATIDRATGSVSINNLPGGAPIELDGYALRSPGGSLDPGEWNSLQNQAVSDFEEANPQNDHLAELIPVGSAVIDGGTTYDLGNVFSPGTAEFGTPVEDLTFEYGRPDGAVVQGTVNYEGIGPSLNNLVLAVDPDSGAGTLVNASPFAIQIDGYAILSDSGALLSGDGQWNSLEDQAMSAWEEANVSANQLAELNPTDSTSLNGGGQLELGTLFDTAGERDLTLEFFLAGEGSARQGVLLYEAVELVEGIPGDYNNSGLVEQGDLDLVLGFWGSEAGDVPATWENDPPVGFVDQAEIDKVLGNWGSQAPGLAATAAVPEPTTVVMGLLAAALLCCRGWSHLRLNLTSQIRGDES